MRLEEFSGGYYRTTMDIQSYEDGPTINRGLYDFINKELYYDSDHPVMMRVGLDGGALFNVNAEPAVPQDVLALPADLVDESGEQYIFVLKSEYAENIGEYHG